MSDHRCSIVGRTRVAQATAPSPGTTVATRFVVPARYARAVNGAFYAVGIAART